MHNTMLSWILGIAFLVWSHHSKIPLTWISTDGRLLYQIIAKRNIEVHRVRPANAPDLLAFVNDFEFNITTISSMTCSNLRSPDTLVTGLPGFVDYRVFPLSTYINYHCYNTSMGPTVSLRCSNCQVPRRDHFISWHFVDLPNNPATAVGFLFNLTAKEHGYGKYMSYVNGTLNSNSDNKPQTFRGPDLNILKIHLFPQNYIRLHKLKLIQPLFHDFIPGSSIAEVNKLQSSLQSPNGGIINTTLYISYLADYVVEIDKENNNGPGKDLFYHVVSCITFRSSMSTCAYNIYFSFNFICHI